MQRCIIILLIYYLSEVEEFGNMLSLSFNFNYNISFLNICDKLTINESCHTNVRVKRTVKWQNQSKLNLYSTTFLSTVIEKMYLVTFHRWT